MHALVTKCYTRKKNTLFLELTDGAVALIKNLLSCYLFFNYHACGIKLHSLNCLTGFTTPKPPTCSSPLGMQNNQIPDSALRASTSYNANSMGPANGRLHFQAKSGKYGSWAVSKNNEFQYFEVNFGDWTRVTRIATQGRQDGGWWTKSYSLAYSYDGVFFEDYKEDNNVKVISSSLTSFRDF